MVRRAGLLAIFLLLVSGASVSAANKTVNIVNYAFQSNSVKVTVGNSVTWHNTTATTKHTTTADVLALWNHTINPGLSIAETMHSAGTFAYHCAIHSQMHGKVKVKMPTPTQNSGTYSITLGNSTLPAGQKHEVQWRKGSAAFAAFGAPTTMSTVSFHPVNPGKYQFRTRLTNGSVVTGWSPVLTITVS